MTNTKQLTMKQQKRIEIYVKLVKSGTPPKQASLEAEQITRIYEVKE